MEIFGSIQFLSLGSAVFGAIIPLLVLAYLFKRKTLNQKVSSLVILKQIPKRTSVTRKVKLPLRFFLELLALIALLLALTEPVEMNKKSKGVILLDNSLSMQATDGVGKSRFKTAQELLVAQISAHSEISSWSLYLTSPALQNIGNSISSGAAIDEINKQKPSFSSDNLASEIKEVNGKEDYKKLFIASDKDNESKTEGDIVYLKVGSSDGNYFINAVSLEPSANTTESQILAVISNANEKALELNVKLYLLRSHNQSADLVATKEVALQKRASIKTSFDINASNSPGVYKIVLENRAMDKRSNAIAADDIAWFSTSSMGLLDILVVSDQGSLLGLDKISSLNPKAVSLSSYNQLNEEQIKEFNFIIFHLVTPDYAPKNHSLFILPPQGNPVFPLKNAVQNPKITSWINSHPLTSYLKVTLLEPATAETFQSSLWAKDIVNSEQGCLVIAGESRGLRYIGVGFEILPFEGSKSLASSIFLLNSVDWLLGGTTIQAQLLSGMVIKTPRQGGFTWIPQSQESKEVTAPENPVLFLPEPGIYRLINNNTKEEKIFAVNSFYPEESDLLNETSIGIPQKAKAQPDLRKESRSLWFYFLLAGFIFLLVDFALRLRSSTNIAEGK